LSAKPGTEGDVRRAAPAALAKGAAAVATEPRVGRIVSSTMRTSRRLVGDTCVRAELHGDGREIPCPKQVQQPRRGWYRDGAAVAYPLLR
jgi:hypothetical protein